MSKVIKLPEIYFVSPNFGLPENSTAREGINKLKAKSESELHSQQTKQIEQIKSNAKRYSPAIKAIMVIFDH